MTKLKESELLGHIKAPVDIFVCFASFEERCLTIPKFLAMNQIVESAVIFSFEDSIAQKSTDANKKKLKNLLGNDVSIKEFPRNKPIQIIDVIIKSIESLLESNGRKEKNILIDISSFSREALLIFFRWLLDFPEQTKQRVQFVYNSAAEYSIDKVQPEDKWLSKGISEIRSILGFSGSMSPLKKLHLIIQVGFEKERALKHIESYEPSITSLGMGGEDCSICDDHYNVNRLKHGALKELYGPVEEFNFSCIHPLQAKEDLKKQVDKHEGYNVIIAPLNTKISAIGAALLAFELPDVQLCYAVANTYNVKGYSAPGEDYYLFNLKELI